MGAGHTVPRGEDSFSRAEKASSEKTWEWHPRSQNTSRWAEDKSVKWSVGVGVVTTERWRDNCPDPLSQTRLSPLPRGHQVTTRGRRAPHPTAHPGHSDAGDSA